MSMEAPMDDDLFATLTTARDTTTVVFLPDVLTISRTDGVTGVHLAHVATLIMRVSEEDHRNLVDAWKKAKVALWKQAPSGIA